jgi:hypothetical protein
MPPAGGGVAGVAGAPGAVDGTPGLLGVGEVGAEAGGFVGALGWAPLPAAGLGFVAGTLGTAAPVVLTVPAVLPLTAAEPAAFAGPTVRPSSLSPASSELEQALRTSAAKETA